ncbi:MAG: ParA family protein [Anaerolineales bacterium]|jgi:chromosome partitioning protein
MTRIYAFVNQKGGVGKTTTAINLAACFALRGQKVLIVDLDPQANATSCLGVDKRQVERGSYEVLIGQIPPAAAMLQNEKLKLTLLPSSPELVGAEVELVAEIGRESRLKEALAELAPSFDYVLVDSPPSFGLLTLNCLVAASSGVIIPVQCEYLALEGLSQLTQTIARVRSAYHPELVVRGVVMTMFDGRSNLANQVVAEVRKYFPDRVFETIIPRSVRLAEAPSHGLPISAYAPSSSGGVAYRWLAEEVLRGDGLPVPAATADTPSVVVERT